MKEWKIEKMVWGICERPGILYRQDGKGYNFVLRGQDHLWRNF